MMNQWQGWLYVAAVLIPLGAFLVELLFGRVLRRLNAIIATAAIGTSFALSVVGFASYLNAAPEMLRQTEHHGAAEEPAHAAEADAHPTPSSAERHGGPVAFTGKFSWVVIGAGLGAQGAKTPGLEIPIEVYVDNLSAIMFVMVTFIATLVHIYSMGYMAEDKRYPRFFTYLSLFCFSMLALLVSANIFMVFMCWELVGVCSFLLIGFWYEEKKNADAANKAFIANRVGDVGMLLGLGLIWSYLGTFNIQEINGGLRDSNGALHARGPDKSEVALVDPATGKDLIEPGTATRRMIPVWALTLAGLGIFAGCVGKSAQFPLHVWLPDAMAGPTPVSALIHAATMVAAGVYLVGRFFPLFTADVLLYIAYTGGITLFIGATIAMVQTDYKKVLAYSTVSQLGFMMLGLGVGGWAAGLFHLITHAFFKALLFLGAGSIYHAVHTYDMGALGGLKRKMPITRLTMLAGTLAIAGVPLFSGFYSKDAILGTALFFVREHPQHLALFILPAVGALITAFYMFRMYFLVFEGTPRPAPADAHGHGHGHGDHGHAQGSVVDHAHESGWRMALPLILLAVPAVVVGYPITILPFFGYEPVLEHMLAYGEPIRAVELGAAKWWAMGGSVLIATTGIAFAALYYSPRRKLDPAIAMSRYGGLYRFFVNKWYFDELYSFLLIRPTMALARAVSRGDKRYVDGLVNGAGSFTVGLSRFEGLFDKFAVDGLVTLVGKGIYLVGDKGRQIQTGRLRTYLLVLAVGVVALFVGIFAWVRPAVAG